MEGLPRARKVLQSCLSQYHHQEATLEAAIELYDRNVVEATCEKCKHKSAVHCERIALGGAVILH